MKRKIKPPLAALLLLAIIISGPAFGGTIYRIIDLGTLPGGISSAHSINDDGAFAGWSQLADGSTRAIAGADGVLTNLGVPFGGWESRADSINTRGQIAGTTQTSTGARATIWTAGLAGNLGTLGGTDSWGLAINNHGSVAGGATTAEGYLRAFVYSDGKMRNVGVLPGGDWSAAYGINAFGSVAGTSTVANGNFHAFSSDGKLMTDLGTLGGRSSYANAINDSGMVAGHAQVSGGAFHSFLWDPQAGMLDLGTLGGLSSFAYGINDAGSVVGTSWLRDAPQMHAFVYTDSLLHDLNDLLEGDRGWELLEASDINVRGQIVGTGLWNGSQHAFRLDPVLDSAPYALTYKSRELIQNPEPGTLLLFATGVCVLFGLRKKF
jgi:probable HAF family extracellular repeat protein